MFEAPYDWLRAFLCEDLDQPVRPVMIKSLAKKGWILQGYPVWSESLLSTWPDGFENILEQFQDIIMTTPLGSTDDETPLERMLLKWETLSEVRNFGHDFNRQVWVFVGATNPRPEVMCITSVHKISRFTFG